MPIEFSAEINESIVLIATHAIALIIGLGLGAVIASFVHD